MVHLHQASTLALVGINILATFVNGSLGPPSSPFIIPETRGGGQQDDTPTGSYHGNYISPQGEQPKATATAVVVDVASPPASTTAEAPLASATSKSSKLTNLQERTGPAVLMLGATYLLLKYTGDKGLIGIILLMQLGLYSESTSVVEVFQEKSGSSIDKIKSYPLQKWWWFTTAMAFSGRCVNSLLC